MTSILFNILFFIVPLVFYKNTSELFEFNKIITLYIFTTLISTVWIINSIKAKKFIFRKTILDIPLIIYLSIYFISSLFSIDPRTSWLGYYGRFNGGLISQICYVILYWAFVSNITAKQSQKAISYMLYAVCIAAILAIGERFGIFATCGLMKLGWYESCWVQDVQNRVFGTLGQPNWLAALLVALIPVTWGLNLKAYGLKRIAYFLLSVLFFVALLFTKSRSGLLAFGVEAIIFWGFIFYKEKAKYLKGFLILCIVSTFVYFIFNPSPVTRNLSQTVPTGPVLETGGTESGTIRKFVWIGAFNVFKHYPILGTGPETFAFSFPMFKPVGHNLTSEWDFIYNKAHNEFLNYLANTGLLGFLSYLSLIIFSIIIFLKSKRYEYLGGYLGILITNFFGFSVVPVSLLFFLLPAFAVVNKIENNEHLKQKKLDANQWLLILGVILTTYYLLHTTYYYWKADIYFNKSDFIKALSISPTEPNYISKLALSENNVENSFKALKLNPYNQNTRRTLISNLASSNNLDIAENVILEGIDKSLHDPRLYYQLGILQLKIAKNDEAVKNIQKSIELKPNYKEARFTLGITFEALKEYEKAKTEFEYILKNIDANDELIKKYLEELKQPQ